jgi:hypothetical protein
MACGLRGGHSAAVNGAARALFFMREPSSKANDERKELLPSY